MQPKCRAGMWRGVPRYLTGPTSREPANQELCAVERHNHVAMRAVYASCAHFAAKRAFQRTHGAFVPRHGGIILH